MRLIVVSGLSGSGKSVALNTLEDEGFYCIDNLPTGLISPLVEQLLTGNMAIHERVAVGIDARSDATDLRAFPELLDRLNGNLSTTEILGVEIDTMTLPVAPGRNLAVLTEAAVRNYMLIRRGYRAGDDLIERQRSAIARDESCD